MVQCLFLRRGDVYIVDFNLANTGGFVGLCGSMLLYLGTRTFSGLALLFLDGLQFRIDFFFHDGLQFRMRLFSLVFFLVSCLALFHENCTFDRYLRIRCRLLSLLWTPFGILTPHLILHTKMFDHIMVTWSCCILKVSWCARLNCCGYKGRVQALQPQSWWSSDSLGITTNERTVHTVKLVKD